MFTHIMTGESWISFPNLLPNTGLKFNIDSTAFTIGSFEVKWYGIMLCLGILACLILGMTTCKKYDIKQDDVLDYVLFALPSAIVGARLYYVIFNFSLYKNDLSSIFDVRSGGLAIYGGIIGAVIALICVSLYKKHKFLKIIDFGIIFIPLGQAIGRWGNFFNQEAYGSVTKMPWGMTGSVIEKEVVAAGYDAGSLVHPTFLYESLWCFALFAFLFVYSRKWKKSHGECLALYMIFYGIERAIVEGLRTDSLYIGNTDIRVSQLLSVVLVIFGITFFIDSRRRYKKEQLDQATEEETSSGLASVIERYDAALSEDKAGAEEAEFMANQSDEIQAYDDINVTDEDSKQS